jgi:ABC-type glycerol-3-phosphate transport system substrate-binding protein
MTVKLPAVLEGPRSDRGMRALVVGAVMAMTLGVAACGSDDSSDTATDDVGTEGTVAAGVPDVIGDSVEDATATLEAAGYTLRVVQRDGEELPATADFIENRVNVAVESQRYGDEVVTEVVSTG